MFTWKYNETVDIHASVDKVWTIWSDSINSVACMGYRIEADHS